MAGRVPALHVFLEAKKDVNAHYKRGHNGGEFDSTRAKCALIFSH
jgi:hypothetical protein